MLHTLHERTKIISDDIESVALHIGNCFYVAAEIEDLGVETAVTVKVVWDEEAAQILGARFNGLGREEGLGTTLLQQLEMDVPF